MFQSYFHYLTSYKNILVCLFFFKSSFKHDCHYTNYNHLKSIKNYYVNYFLTVCKPRG